MTDMSKSRAIAEKETLAGVAMLIIAGGAMALLSCLESDPINWIKMAASGITILIGFGILYMRGVLKFNRWENLYVEE